ncbi:alpha/beta hydrolase [Brevibacterium daeguense]|uniref:Alpha/beta hydrolase n=1 Tax=Brevibacterium daeguense TaxID=909936 RepID=A0ABP8EH76_9MICO|nr:alpha/beta hydrolase [Brevibacterium daeguense]
MTDVRTSTVEIPGGTLLYDVRGDLTDTRHRPLLMVGFPMDATGFTTLSGFFRDRTVVTCDPRGIGRSTATQGDAPPTVRDHAEDLSLLIDALDAGAIDIFASSGGAVNSLALVETHADQVRTLVAHEPPVFTVTSDSENILRVTADITDSYRARGFGAAMAKFLRFLMLEGEVPDDYLDQPDPDPAAFGLPTADDGARNDPMFAGSMLTMPDYEPDLQALSAASTRIVLGVGEESQNIMPGRAAMGIAESLGCDPEIFPSGHGGFLGGEMGHHGEPEEFAEVLRLVLDEG